MSSADGPPDGIWRPRASSHLVLSGLFATQLAGIFAVRMPRNEWAIAFAVLTAALLFAVQLSVAWRGAARWPPRRRLGVLLALAALTYLPVEAPRLVWPGMAGFLAGSVLILRPARTSWLLFALVIASMLVAPLELGYDARDAVYLMLASLSSALTVFAVFQLRLFAKRAQGTGTQLSQLTSVRERERFSMDLHDILGYSLSAITLKAELTRKLVGSDPALAQDELAELIELARQATVDVRLMASGYSSISLAREAGSAASLLSAACIKPQVAIDCGVLDDNVDTVLAIVLREAVTNVLRHSSARNCAIVANQDDTMITLKVVNDGVSRPLKPGTGGHGLNNLARRLAVIGGELSTGASHDDQFSLLAKIPAQGTRVSPADPDESRLRPHPP